MRIEDNPLLFYSIQLTTWYAVETYVQHLEMDDKMKNRLLNLLKDKINELTVLYKQALANKR